MTLLFASLAMNGQKSSIKGKVVSQQNEPIPNVNVMIEHTNIGVISNSKGEFTIRTVKKGEQTLKISSIGYISENITVTIRENQAIDLSVIVLQENNEVLDKIVLEGHKNKYVVREPSRSLRLNTEIEKLPQNIQVISNELLVDQQITSIMDGVTRNVSGVSMIEHWGHFARINMRGFRLPAFRNGINISDSWGPLSEDMSMVERIEFVKGPSGFMMAAGEPGGFYNVVTKKPTATSIKEVSFMIGSFDTYRATLDLGGKLTKDGKLLFRLNGLYQTSDTHRGNEDAERYGFSPSLTYNFSEKTSITTELNFQKAESYIGTAYVFAPVKDGFASLDRDFKFTDTNYPASDISEVTFFTNFKHQLSDNWTFETQFGLLRYGQEGNSTWLASPPTDQGDAVRYVSIWDALSIGKYFQSYLYGKFNTGGISHNVLGGFDFTDKKYWADFYDSGVIDVDQPFNIYNPVYGNTELPEFDRSSNVRNRRAGEPYNASIIRALYVQDEIGFLEDKIRLTLAGRYTNLSSQGKSENDTKFTPRLGLSVDVLPSLTAYALYDQSFLANFGVSATGESFDPEEANDIEGGIKKSFFNNKLKASLGAFIITKENVLVSDPDNPDFSIQLGEIQSKGIEFDLQGKITPELNVTLNYANTNVEITEDSNPENIGIKVAGHAKHMTNGWVNYNFANTSVLKGFGASLGYQYQVERSSWAWDADNQSDLPDYFRLDGALSWRNKKMSVQLNVNNILDEYLYSGANYGSYIYWQSEPGINGRVTVVYRF